MSYSTVIDSLPYAAMYVPRAFMRVCVCMYLLLCFMPWNGTASDKSRFLPCRSALPPLLHTLHILNTPGWWMFGGEVYNSFYLFFRCGFYIYAPVRILTHTGRFCFVFGGREAEERRRHQKWSGRSFEPIFACLLVEVWSKLSEQ